MNLATLKILYCARTGSGSHPHSLRSEDLIAVVNPRKSIQRIWLVDSYEPAFIQREPMNTGIVPVSPDHIALVIDFEQLRTECSGKVNDRKDTIPDQEAMHLAFYFKCPDNLAIVIDAERIGEKSSPGSCKLVKWPLWSRKDSFSSVRRGKTPTMSPLSLMPFALVKVELGTEMVWNPPACTKKPFLPRLAES